MGSSLWPWRSIQVPNVLQIKPGGVTGLNEKIMIFLPGKDFYYTIMIYADPYNLESRILPFNVHKTFPTRPEPERYQVLAKGTLNLQPLIDTVSGLERPSLRIVDLSSQDLRQEEVVPLGQLANVFGQRDLVITPEWAEKLAPIPVSSLEGEPFAAGLSINKGINSGLFLRTSSESYQLRFPDIHTLEERMEESMLESMQVNFLDDLEEDFEGEGVDEVF